MNITFYDKKPNEVYRDYSFDKNQKFFKKEFLVNLTKEINNKLIGKLLKPNIESIYCLNKSLVYEEGLRNVVFKPKNEPFFFVSIKQRSHISNQAFVKLLYNNKIYYHLIKLHAEPIYFDSKRIEGKYRWSYDLPYFSIEESVKYGDAIEWVLQYK